jgi:putative ABC transport system substrate-binding protein
MIGSLPKRRRFPVVILAALALALLVVALPLALEAQPAAKLPRLCFLTFDPGTLRSTRYVAFFQGLADLGYRDGQTIAVDYLSAEGRAERLPTLAAECVRLKADVIVVTTTPLAQAAKDATRTIPIVMLALGDPVGTRLIDSLSRPGGNVTGVTSMSSGLSAKRLELLKAAAPRISRVLVLAYLVDPIAAPQVVELKKAAVALGVQLQIRDIRTADDLSAAFDAGAKERADALLVTTASIFIVHRTRLTELAARYRLPAMYGNKLFADVGGLMTHDASRSILEVSTATYVDRVLKGAKPADLPVEQPTKFELTINTKTAKALGLTIPPSILLRADQVID